MIQKESLERKLLRASSENLSCLWEIVSLLNQCISKKNQDQLETEKELKILGKDFKKQMNENMSLTLNKTVSKMKRNSKFIL